MEDKLELFAIIELFGHNVIAGRVTEQTVGSSTFVRVDVPETAQQPPFTRLLNPSAIYAINPVTEPVMQIRADQLNTKPIDAWDISKMTEKLLLLKQQNEQHKADDDDDTCF